MINCRVRSDRGGLADFMRRLIYQAVYQVNADLLNEWKTSDMAGATASIKAMLEKSYREKRGVNYPKRLVRELKNGIMFEQLLSRRIDVLFEWRDS
jgi:hypothetical protein